VAAITWPLLMAEVLQAQQPKPSEYQVRAAYLYNFGKFVEWPATATNQVAFDICVLGQDPFTQTLDATLAGKTLEGKPVEIKNIAKPQEAAGCRILFIGSTQASHLREILAGLDQNPVLTVSDIPDFIQHGGMIQFVLEGERVRFSVNLANAESARLTLSSELLKVAVDVKGNAQHGG
jgi:hypothetical protein